MKGKKIFALCAVFLYSCVSTVDVLKPTGDTATVTLKNGYRTNVELLALSDTTIIAVHNAKMVQTSFDNVNSIYVQGYRIESGAKALSAIPILFVEGLLAVVAFDIGQSGWGLISGLAIVATIAAFSSGEPKSNFMRPFGQDDVEKLRLFCRYPQALSEKQSKDLMQHFHQDSILPLPERGQSKTQS